MKRILLLIFLFLNIANNVYGFEFNNIKVINVLTPHLTYVAPSCQENDYVGPYGDTTGVPAIANGESRNAYRGIYWTGESRRLCEVSVYLAREGNPDLYNWKISVWTVDPTNNLQLDQELTSITVSGSDIITGYNNFLFPQEIDLISGKTVIIVSREDFGGDNVNHLSLRVDFDEGDEESRQWFIHYYQNGVMAGRSSGDEDQPEYYAGTINFNSFIKVNPITDYPNIPENVQTSINSSTSILIDWEEKGQNQVIIDYYNVYLYNINDATTTLIASSTDTQYIHTGLLSGTYTYVVTAVSNTGNESYHSLKNTETSQGGNGWQTTLP